MRSILLIAWFVGSVVTTAVYARGRGNSSKEYAGAVKLGVAKDPKSDLIKEADAIKFIQTRLEESTGVKGWKIVLKEAIGPARDFSAEAAGATQAGTINVTKAYPNGGALRVYLVPKD